MSEHIISSRRELRLKQSELRRNALIIFSVVVGLLLALIATDTWKLGAGPQPSLSKSIGKINAEGSNPAKASGKELGILRELSADEPLRVYIGGDSLVGSFGSELASSMGKTGVVKAAYDSRPSSGLTSKNFFDWESHIKKIVSKYDPEIVVFMIGTNDASMVSANPDGYKETYTGLLESFLESAQSDRREVVFVLAPAMKEATLNRGVNKINEVIEDVAYSRSILTLDSSEILSPSGKFASSIELGKKVNVRAGDGVHISNEGGKLLATQVKAFLYYNFGIDRFRAPKPIEAIKVAGCCTSPKVVPSGTTRKQFAPTSTTTAPTTTPPTTTADSSTNASGTDQNNSSGNLENLGGGGGA